MGRPTDPSEIETGPATADAVTADPSLAPKTFPSLKKLRPGSPEYLAEVFQYHAPTVDQIDGYQKIRRAAQVFAQVIVDNTPASADQSDALRKLRETVMTANSSIALGGRA